ncbi:hypothetical protein DPMN_015798 [Dreissena polymorpha]|uniref:Uncharacterized protein n=1 Tax=Dreissena polymorpha TaxID=45954 RepID=A0A9D4N8G4_DREPO|nr:hypothetical protein DPMN_015798 [Dreissena polymorpha]
MPLELEGHVDPGGPNSGSGDDHGQEKHAGLAVYVDFCGVVNVDIDIWRCNKVYIIVVSVFTPRIAQTCSI